MKRLLLILFFAIFTIASAAAEMVAEQDKGTVVVKKSSTDDVMKFFRKYPYNYAKTEAEIPRVFFQRLPYDWDRAPESASKNRNFIRILLPLVLKVNEEITEERKEVFELYRKARRAIPLSEKETERIEVLATKYEAFTPNKRDGRALILLKQLFKKVDAVPPSIMISTAIIYSNWGTSRLAIENNSLYKEEVWYTNQGIKPKDDPDADYRYRVFSNLEDCIRARALRLNSHIDYDYFRHTRMYQQRMQQAPNGINLAAQMMHDSNLQNISGIIDYTFSFYKLEKTDQRPKLVDFKGKL